MNIQNKNKEEKTMFMITRIHADNNTTKRIDITRVNDATFVMREYSGNKNNC